MEQQLFKFKTIWLAARPPRIAVLVQRDDPDWKDTVLRIIEWLSKCWGGNYGVIMPSDGESIDERFWYILEKYDPDYIYYYKKTYLDLKISKPEEYKTWLEDRVLKYHRKYPDQDLDRATKEIDQQAENTALDSFSISNTLQSELKKRLNPFFYRDHVVKGWIRAGSKPSYPLTPFQVAIKSKGEDYIFPITYPIIDGSKEIQILSYSLLGKADNYFMEAMRKIPTVSVSELTCSGDALRELANEAWQDEIETTGSMPFRATQIGLNFFYKSQERNEWGEKSIIIVGDTLDDFCLYYNLSRLRWHVYWLPMKKVNDYIEAKKNAREDRQGVEGENAYPEWLMDELERVLRDKEDRLVHLYSTSCTDEDFELAKQAIRKVYPEEAGWESLNIRFEIAHSLKELLSYVKRLYTQAGVRPGYVEQFFQNESVNYLNTPIPKEFPSIPPHGHFWLTEVKIADYFLPLGPNYGPMSILMKNYDNNEVRVSREGLVYFCPYIGYSPGWGGIEQVVARPKLRLLDDFAIIEELFQSGGYSIKYSDKGNYHRESCLKFGGFDQLSDFMADDKKRNLMMKFLDKADSRRGEDVFLKNEQRRYLLFSGMRNILETDETPKIMDDLVEKGVLYRGFIFKCQKCRNLQWYPIKEVGDTFTCSRCRTPQIYKIEHWKEPVEGPLWYYQLAEVIYQGLNHNMHVPILALKYLKKEAKQAFHYVPEIEIRKDPTSPKPDVEIDLVVIIDGNIYIGDATISDTLSKSEILKIKRIVLSIQTREVVLATFADKWSLATEKNIQDQFKDLSVSKKLLTKSELIGQLISCNNSQ